MSLDELVRSATSRAGIIRVRNVLNPLLWLCAVTTPISFLFAYLLGGDAIPNRLQSEEFVLRQQELTIIERKRAPPLPLNLDLTDESLIAPKQASSNREADPK